MSFILKKHYLTYKYIQRKMGTKPLSKDWQNDWIQALNEISVQLFTDH